MIQSGGSYLSTPKGACHCTSSATQQLPPASLQPIERSNSSTWPLFHVTFREGAIPGMHTAPPDCQGTKLCPPGKSTGRELHWWNCDVERKPHKAPFEDARREFSGSVSAPKQGATKGEADESFPNLFPRCAGQLQLAESLSESELAARWHGNSFPLPPPINSKSRLSCGLIQGKVSR